MRFGRKYIGKYIAVPALLGSIVLGGVFLWPADSALAFGAPVIQPITSTCGGVAGDGSSDPQNMQSPGGPFITISWDPVPDAVEYRIWRQRENEGWKRVKAGRWVTPTSFEEKLALFSQLPDSYYKSGTLSYYVEAISSTGATAGGPADARSIATPLCIPFLQVFPMCDPAERGFLLHFTATRDVVLYDVFRNTAPSIVQRNIPDHFDSLSGYLFYLDGIAAETAPFTKYWMEAAGAGGQRWKSNEVTKALDCSASAPAPDPPTITKLEPFCENNTDSRIRVEWTASDNILHYTVWRRVQGDTGPGASRGDFVSTWMNDNTQGSGGINFQYRIEAVGTGGTSSFSAWEPGNTIAGPVTAPLCGTPSPPPNFTKLEANCTGGLGVDIEWVKSVGAERYKIFRQGPGDTALVFYREFIDGVHSEFSTRKFRDTDVVSNKTYSYKIEAHGTGGTTPSASTVESLTTPNCSAPGAFTLSVAQAPQCVDAYLRAKLSWTESTNATSYDILQNQVSPALTTRFSNVPFPPREFTDIGLGRALDFDGVNDYIEIAGDLGDPSAMSIEFWFYVTGADKTRTQYFLDGRAGGNWWFLQSYNPDGSGNINFFDRVKVSAADWQAGKWNHLVLTSNSSASKIYINGELKATGSGGDPDIGSGMRIGTRYTGSDYFRGRFDEVRIYSRVLIDAEIASRYQGVYSDETGLLGRWHFDEGSGQTASDSSNNGNHGTLGTSIGVDSGDPTWVDSGMFFQRDYNWRAEAIGPGGSTFATPDPTATHSAPMCKPPKPGIFLMPVCQDVGGILKPAMEVKVSYSINANATGGYEIRRDGAGLIGTLNQSPLLADRTFIDTNGGAGLTPLTGYTYRVKAIGSVGQDESEPATKTALDCSPPTIPQNVTAVFECAGAGNTSPPRARVSWDDSNNATSYSVWRDNNNDGIPDVSIPPTIADTNAAWPNSTRYTTFVDSSIAVGTKYTYMVKAVGPGGESAFSDPLNATIDPATHPDRNYCKPPAPTITTLTTACSVGNPVNTLSWTAESTPNNTASYEIYRNTVNSRPAAPLASGITSTTWSDTALTSPGDINTTFYYWVKAVGAGPTTLKSDDSASKSVQTLACGIAPGTPSISVTGNQCVQGEPQITLDWAGTTNAISYDVRRTNPDASVSVYQNRWHPFTDNGSYALSFDGVNDYVSVSGLPSLALNNLSVSLWLRPNVQWNSSSGLIQPLRDNGGGYEIIYNCVGGGLTFSLGGGCDASDPLYLSNLEANTWYHIVGTYDHGTRRIKLYINGTLVDSEISTRVPGSSSGICVGATCGFGRFANGIIDDVRIHNRELSAAEVDALYNGNSVSPYGLVGMWHFDKGSGTSAKDDSGTGNDGTLQNEPMWVQLTNTDPTYDSDPLANATLYAYKVRALGVDTESGHSNSVSATTPDCRPLDQAPAVALQCDLGTVLPFIRLSWIVDPNTQYWDLYRKKTSDIDWGLPIASNIPNTTTSYDDKSVEPGEEYHYFLEGLGFSGESSCDPDGCEVSASIIADQQAACGAPPKPIWVPEGTFPYCSGNVPRNRLEWKGEVKFKVSGGTYNVHRTNPDSTQTTFTNVGNLHIRSSAGEIGTFFSFIDQSPELVAFAGIEVSYKVEAKGSSGSTPSDDKLIEVKANCATLPPETFQAFVPAPGEVISRGDLRAIPLKWTSAQTETYYKVFRTDGFTTEQEAIDARNDNLFTPVPNPDSQRDRGVDYPNGLPPAADCTITENCIFYTDAERGPATPWLEDGLWYYYRVIAYKPVPGKTCNLIGETDVECRGADAGTVFLPVAAPGKFSINSKEILRDVDGKPIAVRLTWNEAVWTAKGGEPTYKVERSRTINFASATDVCTGVPNTNRTCDDNNPLRGLTFYRVRAANAGGDTLSGNIVQAGLFLFPEEWIEISPL